MADVSAVGIVAWFYDSKIFPNGFPVTEYGDGADAFDVSNVTVGAATMDVNGNMVYAATPAPSTLKFVLLPQTEAARNMQILIDAHRAVGGRQRTGGAISITMQYPDGQSASFTECFLINAPVAYSVQNPGRFKNLEIEFAYKDVIRS